MPLLALMTLALKPQSDSERITHHIAVSPAYVTVLTH